MKKIKLPKEIKIIPLKKLINNYYLSYKNIIELDEEILNKYSLIEHQHNKALTY